MAYLTFHSLDTLPAEMYEYIADDLERVSHYGKALWNDPIAWVSLQADCIRVSAEHPEILFAVTGMGNEFGDIWRKTFFRGMQIGDLRPEPYKFPKLAWPDKVKVNGTTE